MNTMNNSQTLNFRTPALAPDKKSAAAIVSVSLTKCEGQEDVLRFVIRRDLKKKITSFTIRYRFSRVPVFKPDENAKFNEYVYSAGDINTDETIKISAIIPRRISVVDCGAYISEIVFADGTTVTYGAEEYRFMRKLPTQAQANSAPARGANTPAAAPKAATALAEKQKKQFVKPALSEAEKEARRGKRLVIILSVVLVVLIAEIIGGVALYRYLGIKNSTDMLMNDGRYNEAYKLALEEGHNGALQRVCEKAALYYYNAGDLESAYVYALGAPKPFTDLIIDYAAKSVINPTTGKINENAFRVAKMSENDDKFDSITHSVCDILSSVGDYPNALRVVSELRNETDRAETENTVFENAIAYYLGTHRYREATAFIEELENIDTFKRTKADVIDAAVKVAKSIGDNAGIIYLSQCYPEYTDISAADTYIAEDDAGVRSEFSVIYPLLSASQRRSYHAQSVAVWKDDPIVIKNGAIAGTKITNAISVDTNETVMLVLHKTGKVSVVAHKGATAPFTAPSYSDIIDIALGEEHAVLLHENGTVSVLGQNKYGEADVSDWTDIVAVAAGQRFTLGLKSDGTVVAAGSNTCGQCDVSVYRNVVDIAACNQSAVMLFSGGTVAVQGYRSMELDKVKDLVGVKRIRAGASAVLVALEDGSYKLLSGAFGGSYGDPYNWLNMAAFDVGVMCIAGVDNIGVLLCDGDGIPS